MKFCVYKKIIINNKIGVEKIQTSVQKIIVNLRSTNSIQQYKI